MGRYAFSLIENETNFWLDIPTKERGAYEGTLVNLLNQEDAAKSFLEIVPNAIDILSMINDFARNMSKGKVNEVKLSDEIKEKVQFHSYYKPIDINQADYLCACRSEYETRWRRFLAAKSVIPRFELVSPCFIPGCEYKLQALIVPISKVDIMLPDEDGFTNEIVLPELKIIFPNKEIHRDFIFLPARNRGIISPNRWITINTCPEHTSKKYFKEYVRKCGDDLGASFSEKICSIDILAKSHGIEIDEELYR